MDLSKNDSLALFLRSIERILFTSFFSRGHGNHSSVYVSLFTF